MMNNKEVMAIFIKHCMGKSIVLILSTDLLPGTSAAI